MGFLRPERSGLVRSYRQGEPRRIGAATRREPDMTAVSERNAVAESALWRPAALAAGPIGLVALAAFIASVVRDGDDEIALITSELSIGASVAGLACLALLTLGAAGLAGRISALRRGFGLVASTVAVVGTVLGAGGQWAQLFVLPGLATVAPDVATNGLGSVLTGYIVSYIIMAIGWVLVGSVLLRTGAPKAASILVIVGALLCIAPLPVRFFLLAIAVSLVARWTPAR